MAYRGYDSPGVGYTELEKHYKSVSSSNMCRIAVIGGAQKGPVGEPVEIVNPRMMAKVFGDVVESDWGIWGAMKCLEYTSQLTYVRVGGSSNSLAESYNEVGGTKTATSHINPLNFKAKEVGTDLNGAKITFQGAGVDGRFNYTLTSASGRLMESYPGLIVDPDDVSSITSLVSQLNSYSNYITVTKDNTNRTFPANGFTAYLDGALVSMVKAKSYRSSSEPSEITHDSKYYFESIEFDSTLNGATINIAQEAISGPGITWRYTLTSADGTLLESIGGCVDSGEPDYNNEAYIVNAVNRQSKYVTMAFDSQYIGTQYWGLSVTLRGAIDGIDSITPNDIIGAIKKFGNPEWTSIDVLIIPGWSDSNVLNAAKAMVEKRGDCIYIPDIPEGLASNAVAQQYRNVSSPWVAIFYPWVEEYDSVTKEKRMTPPAAWVAAQMAYNDRISDCWFTVAGLQTDEKRGLLSHATGVERKLSKEERDDLYNDTNTINPIAYFNTDGVVIWGNKTTLKAPQYEDSSVFSFLNIRRLCNYIRKIIIEVSRSELFNPNDETTWTSWKLKLDTRLRAIALGRGLDAYRIVMDKTTVSEDDIRNGRMPGEVWIKPVKPAEWIPVTFVVTEDAIFFSEEE